MTGITLESLGMTQQELQERVVTKICDDLLATECFDNSEGEAYRDDSPLAQKLRVEIRKRIDRGIAAIAETQVLPNVEKYIENICLQETNRWGEATGRALTFREYLVQRAEAYLQETVNYEGKTKEEAGSYSWSGKQTRITNLVHKHLHYTIESAMKEAVGNVH